MEHVTFFFASGSWWLYAILVVVGIALAWLTYTQTSPPIAQGRRYILVGLRSIGIALLAISLFEPILRSIISEERTPPVLLAVDESASMLKRDRSGREAIETTELLLNEFGDRAAMIGFNGSVREITDVDSIKRTGQRTDMSAVITWAANRDAKSRPAAIILISDGNANTGDNAAYVAERTGVGVYAVAIGDTVQPVDAAVLSLITSGITVVNEPTTISAMVGASGLEGAEAYLELLEENKVVARDTILLPSSGIRKKADFKWIPTATGLRKVTVRMTTSKGESTTANNSARDLVDVRSAKRTIYLFAGAPSPDVRFIRSILESDKNINVHAHIQKEEGSFYVDSPSASELSKAEAIVMVGFPINSTPRAIVQRVADAAKQGVATLWIASREVDYAMLAPFQDVLPFSVAASRPSEFQVTPDVKASSITDPVMKVTGTERDADVWSTLPPIYRTETFVTPRAGASTLATVRVNNVPLAEPLILKREFGNSRSIAILGYGLYRWELLGQGPAASRGEDVVDVLARFVSNGIGWLAVRDDERRVRIRTDRLFYAAGETVVIRANVLDESFAPVDAADVRVTIKAGSASRDVVLSGLGGGRYVASIERLAPGSYTMIGEARLGDRSLGKDNSRFEIGELGLEEAAVATNINYLRAVSERAGGVTVTKDNLDSLIAAVLKDPRMADRAFTHERDQALWQLPWLLLAAITSFSLEWFLRKRSGLV